MRSHNSDLCKLLLCEIRYLRIHCNYQPNKTWSGRSRLVIHRKIRPKVDSPRFALRYEASKQYANQLVAKPRWRTRLFCKVCGTTRELKLCTSKPCLWQEVSVIIQPKAANGRIRVNVKLWSRRALMIRTSTAAAILSRSHSLTSCLPRF